MAIRQKLVNVCGALYTVYNVSIRNQLATKVEFQEIIRSKQYCVIKLYLLIQKTCNKWVNAEVEDAMRNFLEPLYLIIQIHSEEYNYLPKYLEATEYRYQVLKEAEIDLTREDLGDTYLLKLCS